MHCFLDEVPLQQNWAYLSTLTMSWELTNRMACPDVLLCKPQIKKLLTRTSRVKSSAHYLWSEVQWNYVMQCDEMLKLSCTATAVLTYIPDQSFHTWSIIQTNFKRQNTSVIQKNWAITIKKSILHWNLALHSAADPVHNSNSSFWEEN